MRHLSIPAALIIGCLSTGSVLAQSSIGGGSTGSSSIGSSPSTGSISSPNSSSSPNSLGSTSNAPNRRLFNEGLQGRSGSLSNEGLQGSRGSVAEEGLQDVTRDGGRSLGDVDLGPARDITTGNPVPAPEAERNRTGSATSERNTTEPATTGSVSGVNRNPGEPSRIPPTEREEKLFQQGEIIEQEARQGICQGCGAGER